MSTPGTVNYPATLDDAVSLLEATNGAATALTAALTAVATTADVGSTSTFPSTGAVVFSGVEIAYYTGKTATTLTGLIRGQDGTAAAAHIASAGAQGRIIARHHTALAEALIATQSRLDTHTHTFASLAGQPTTLAGYGITDAYTTAQSDGLYSVLGHTHNANSLSGTALPAGVVTSSLTAVGTIATGVWNGTAIADTYLATISTAGKVDNSATTATSANTASAIVARDASGDFAAGVITASLTGLASLNLPLAGGTMTGQITSALGTIATDIRVLSATATWTNAAVAFNGLFLDITNTASNAASLLLDLRVDGVSRIYSTIGGTTVFRGVGAVDDILRVLNTAGSAILAINTYGNIYGWDRMFSLYIDLYRNITVADAQSIGWSSNSTPTSAQDTALSRNSAGVVEINNGTVGTYRDLKLRNLFLVAGASTTFARTGGVVADFFTDVSVGGAEADIYSTTTAASILAVNGDKLVAQYGGNFVTVGTELTQLKVYFGGSVIWDSTALAPPTGTTSWNVEVRIIRVSATVVRYTVSLNTTDATGYVYATSGELTALTLTATNVLKITGTSSGAGSGAGDIVGTSGFVKWESAA